MKPLFSDPLSVTKVTYLTLTPLYVTTLGPLTKLTKFFHQSTSSFTLFSTNQRQALQFKFFHPPSCFGTKKKIHLILNCTIPTFSLCYIHFFHRRHLFMQINTSFAFRN